MNTTKVWEELYRSLGMISDDNEDGENDREYDEEVENNEEHILGDEFDVDREPYDTFTEEDVSVGTISIGDDTAKYITYYCNRARNRKIKYTTNSNNCKARITAIVDNYDFWHVSKVFNGHNHDFLLAISRLMTSRTGRLVKYLKRGLVAHNRSRIRPSKNIRLAEVQRGGPQNLDCTPKDRRNFILKSRNFEMQEGDVQSLLNFFHEMQTLIIVELCEMHTYHITQPSTIINIY
ncbi:hypothetical protein KY289_007861 [Solanum tuberosum]|nr:hypothetical protein KY289_007861 [Solanum tuberosum]